MVVYALYSPVIDFPSRRLETGWIFPVGSTGKQKDRGGMKLMVVEDRSLGLS